MVAAIVKYNKGYPNSDTVLFDGKVYFMQQNEGMNEIGSTHALDLLTDGFKIVWPDVAKELCKLLGVPFTDDLIENDYVINDLISTRTGNEAGVDCLTLGYYAIKKLGLGEAPGMIYSNRAMQAVANTPLLKQALHITDGKGSYTS